MTISKAHPVVPGSSTYRGGERNLKRGVGFQFFRCLGLLIRMAVASIYGLLAQRDCRDADRSQLLNALSRPPQTASSYHILGYLGQRDEPSSGCWLTRRSRFRRIGKSGLA